MTKKISNVWLSHTYLVESGCPAGPRNFCIFRFEALTTLNARGRGSNAKFRAISLLNPLIRFAKQLAPLRSIVALLDILNAIDRSDSGDCASGDSLAHGLQTQRASTNDPQGNSYALVPNLLSAIGFQYDPDGAKHGK